MYKLRKPSYITSTIDITQYPEPENKIAEVLIQTALIDEESKLKLEEISSPESVRSDLSDGFNDTVENVSIITSKEEKKGVKREVTDEIDKVRKRAKRLDRIKGKYFETKENMQTFETSYDVEVVILSKEQQINEVLERKLSYNYQNGPFKCDDCYKGFIDEDNYMKHYKSQHDPVSVFTLLRI